MEITTSISSEGLYIPVQYSIFIWNCQVFFSLEKYNFQKIPVIIAI